MLDGKRTPEHKVDPLFPSRWSPRAFSDKKVTNDDLLSLFEAARWSPSCFNEQPWLFLYATESKDRALFLSLLVDSNQVWAKNAPVLAFALSKKTFTKNGKPNRLAPFDTGAAWMSLVLAASQKGLSTHGMGGFHSDLAYEKLGVPPDSFEIQCAFAIGYRGDKADLPAELQERETPSQRKPLDQVAVVGGFPKDLVY